MLEQNHAAMKAAAISKLNDRLRVEGRGGHYCLSEPVFALSEKSYADVETAIRAYDSFDDMDPLDEHDHGTARVHGETYVWEMSCLSRDGLQNSPDRSDPEVTERRMTISLVSERIYSSNPSCIRFGMNAFGQGPTDTTESK